MKKKLNRVYKIFTEKMDFSNAHPCCSDNNNIKQLILVPLQIDENKENNNPAATSLDNVKAIISDTKTKDYTPTITNNNNNNNDPED